MAANVFTPCLTREEHHARRVAAALWVVAALMLAALSTWANQPAFA